MEETVVVRAVVEGTVVVGSFVKGLMMERIEERQ